MDLVSVVLFLVMYYIRPQEWSSIFSQIHFVQLVMMMSLWCLFFRDRSLKLGDLFKTPHDWMIMAFFAWAVLTSPTPVATAKDMYTLVIFYVVIVQTLTTSKRLSLFMGWWTFLILAVAILALASEYGFDPLGGYDITHGSMKDRLILRLSIFDNPNALGHNVVPALTMLYFFCVWKRPIHIKQMGTLLMAIPLWCIWLTVSKGAFLSSAATILATLTFGRPKMVQIILLVFAFAFGGALISQLPRMTELNKTKTDQAIQGRVAAFKHGLHRIETSWRGAGFRQWLVDFHRTHNYWKAAHSSYVQIGGELGWTGFAIFLGVLYCNMKTLLTAKTTNADDERLRRMLFVLVLSYMISSWMVDFGYRPTFFMFTAAIAAFHRHLYGLSDPLPSHVSSNPLGLPAWQARLLNKPKLPELKGSELAPAPPGFIPALPALPQPVPAGMPPGMIPPGGLPSVMRSSMPAAPGSMPQGGAWLKPVIVPEQTKEKPKFWNRISFLDLAMIYGLTKLTIIIWQRAAARM